MRSLARPTVGSSPADRGRPSRFVRQFLTNFLDAQLTKGTITPKEFQEHQRFLNNYSNVEAASKLLFDNAPDPIRFDSIGSFAIAYLEEPNGRQFPFLHAVTKRSKGNKKRLTSFVGHRFLPQIGRALRLNLSHLLEPHGIRLKWANQDLSAKELFPSIVQDIRTSDMCIFDNYGTLNKPNVYVEIGIAYAFKKPMIFCAHQPRRSAITKVKNAAEHIPSDLTGLSRLQYKNYQDLCKQLYFSLPYFLAENKLGRRRRVTRTYS